MGSRLPPYCLEAASTATAPTIEATIVDESSSRMEPVQSPAPNLIDVPEKLPSDRNPYRPLCALCSYVETAGVRQRSDANSLQYRLRDLYAIWRASLEKFDGDRITARMFLMRQQPISR